MRRLAFMVAAATLLFLTACGTSTGPRVEDAGSGATDAGFDAGVDAGGVDAGSSCRPTGTCPAGQECCAETGECYDPDCKSCCMVILI